MVNNMAGNRGGARAGAGRPASGKVSRTQELIRKATEDGVTPMEVILSDMRYFHKLGEDKMRQAEQTAPGDKQAKAFRAATALKDIARACAKEAAPYIHPKLASTQVTGNEGGPIELSLEVSFVSPKNKG